MSQSRIVSHRLVKKPASPSWLPDFERAVTFSLFKIEMMCFATVVRRIDMLPVVEMELLILQQLPLETLNCGMTAIEMQLVAWQIPQRIVFR